MTVRRKMLHLVASIDEALRGEDGFRPFRPAWLLYLPLLRENEYSSTLYFY